jgi:hypothetical protein
MRKLGLAALVALLTLTPVSAASAKSKVEAFASKHHFKGAWKAKDVDKDGLKNLKEFKLGTDPRKADTDRDGLRDGDELASGNDPRKADTDGDGVKDGLEHAGVVTAFDGATITFREFATGKKVTATLDTDCTPALVEDEEEPVADDSDVEDVEGDGELFQDEPVEDEDGDCEDAELEKGVVLKSAELEDDHVTAYELA